MLSAMKHLVPRVRSFAALRMTMGEEDDNRGDSLKLMYIRADESAVCAINRHLRFAGMHVT
jgi:hypothetical protein